jgi:flagellar motor switch protein FliM
MVELQQRAQQPEPELTPSSRLELGESREPAVAVVPQDRSALTQDDTKENRVEEAIRPHDFRAPAFLAPRQWRKLRREHEEYAKAVADRLSSLLRVEVQVSLANLETKSFAELVAASLEPAHLTQFKIEPLRGICLLNLPPQIALVLVDLLLGGNGENIGNQRELTEIETALLEEALLAIIQEWCNRWHAGQEMRPSLLGHETNARDLQNTGGNSLFLAATFAARFHKTEERFSLALPCPAIESLLLRNAPDAEASAPAKTAPAKRKPLWRPEFDDLQAPINAFWPERQITTREISELKIGDVLKYDPAITSQIRIRVAGSTKFIGRLGTCDGKWAIEIINAVPSATK